MTRAERIAQIKLHIRAGTYKVDPAAVAEAMLNRSQDLGLKLQEKRSEVRALDYNGVPQQEIAETTGLHEATVARILDRHCRPAFHVQRKAA
jgi:DNA-directed RNA polymerase specialized sigma24 family protein